MRQKSHISEMGNITNFQLETMKKATLQNYFRCKNDGKIGLKMHNVCGLNLAVSE